MNILLVSQCDKRALTETRRILDQFAERRGDRVWQTPITQAGLDTLRRLLRKTARKNTAVACHWIRGRDHSELLWIVGDARRFNDQGAAPTHTTARNILRAEDENDWHTLEDIRLLAQMAALLHDLGKACAAFQERLRERPRETNLYRHEWVSLRLFLAFVGEGNDEDWLKRLAVPASEDAPWQSSAHFFRDGLDEKPPKPFDGLAERCPLAAAIAWLIVSHHRLPTVPVWEDGQQAWLGKRSSIVGTTRQLENLLEQISHTWNERKRAVGEEEDVSAYWRFEQGLPVTQARWRKEVMKVAARLLALREKPGRGNWLNNPYVMHLSRLALMLADHHYSALKPDSPERVKRDKGYALLANTTKDGDKNQTLDEHLLGVAQNAAGIVYAMPRFNQQLPRLARHRGLKKRTTKERFTWQNKAADAATAMRAQSVEQGGFIINMASTGCGKTLANARILNALADPKEGLRATFALGLRTLTLQTGCSYRENLHLNEDELAVRVGGAASRDLFEYYRGDAEASGSASVQALMEEDEHVLYEGSPVNEGLLAKTVQDPRIRSLIAAPMLVCTIDHLMPATEAQRAGRQIAPMLRLMSSDLVLDELDDFGLSDLPALTRLVHWAGLLGTRVLLSSATLPPALVEGLFLAYRAGRRHFLANRGPGGGRVCGEEAELPVSCLWVDEFDAHPASVADLDTFRRQHAAFVQKRVRALEKAEPCRRGELVPLEIKSKKTEEIHREFAAQVREAMLRAHDRHHETCPKSGKQVSFGLVRMANIEPLFDVALALFKLGAPEGYRIHLCVYHSRFPLLLRSAIERRLDTALDRRKPEAVYALPEIREALDRYPEEQHLFVVLGSPVMEVGRDFCLDWAVVEPSSMRSLIQLAGRVQRHRQKTCREGEANILIFDTNLRHFRPEKDAEGNPLAAFVRPGFESEARNVRDPFRLTRHRLGKLLSEDGYKIISARPRIQPRPESDWQPKQNLVDLEHVRLVEAMLPGTKEESESLNAATAWQHSHAALTWVLPQQFPFREKSGYKEVDLLFLADDDGELRLHYIEKTSDKRVKLYIPYQEGYLHKISPEDLKGPRISPWGNNDLLALLQEQAEARELSLEECAERFTTVRVPDSDAGWRYHPVLGFAKQK